MAENDIERIIAERERNRPPIGTPPGGRAAEGGGDPVLEIGRGPLSIAASESVRVRDAVDRGDSFLDILRQSAGFKSNAEAEEYLNYVAGKRDALLATAEGKGVMDISPGLLHLASDPRSHLRQRAKDYFMTPGDSPSDQFSPIIRRANRGFWDRLFNPEFRGRLWRHGPGAAEEEGGLHPFNTIDNSDPDVGTKAQVSVIGMAPYRRGLVYSTPSERRLHTHGGGVYEQIRLAEFQRALAGLKRAALRYVNQATPEEPVSRRADTASQMVREILHKSREVYESTDGSTIAKDDAMFNMLRRDFKNVLLHDAATDESTGFPQHVETAVRAYATLPARARGDGGLYNQLVLTEMGEEKPPLNAVDLRRLDEALDLMDMLVPPSDENRPPDSLPKWEGLYDKPDLIDATADAAGASGHHGQHSDPTVKWANQAAERGGETLDTPGTPGAPVPDGSAPVQPGGPRIVINPTTFTNKKDALCVAFNEGFRLWMESAGFEPQSEPTDAQRRFFSDTAYADDEVQLRRTILARIATFDTSVKDPTDDQLSETASFLNEILESDWCKNDWERDCVSRLASAVQAAVGAEPVEPRQAPLEPREPEPLQKRAALGAGETEDDEDELKKNPAPVQQDQGGETQEGAETTLTSGSGAEVRYNEDGTFAGQTNPDGSYSVASASGDVANYNPDGTLQGDRSRFEAEGTTAAESAVARADRLLERLKGIKEQVDAVDAKYGISERLAPANVAEDKPADAPEGQPGDGGHTPPAGVAIVAVPAAKKPAAETPAQNNGPSGAAQTAAPAAAAEPAPAAAAGRRIGDVGAKSFTNTKAMNGPSIQPAQQIGGVGAKSFTDTQTMNGPSVEPVRPIGTIDTADGSGGSTLRRKKRRRSRI